MQNRIRIKSIEGDNRPATDIFSGKAPAFYRANGLAIEVGVFDRTLALADLTGLTGVRLKLMTTGPDGGPGGDPALLYWEELVEAEDFETPTVADWKDGTKAHVTWTLTPAQTALAQGTYWLWAVSEGAVERTLFAGKVIVREDGSGAGEIQEPEPLQELRDEAVAAAAAAAADRVAVEAKAAQVTDDRAAVQALRDEVETLAPQIVDDAATAGAAAAQVVADNLAALGESLSYRGTWSTNDAPDPAERGWYWMIAASCAFGGELWTPGDAALYNGDAWQKIALDDILTGLKADLPQALPSALHLDGSAGASVPMPGLTGTDIALAGAVRAFTADIHPQGSPGCIMSAGGGAGGGWNWTLGSTVVYFAAWQASGSMHWQVSWPGALINIGHPVRLALVVDFSTPGAPAATLVIAGQVQGAPTVLTVPTGTYVDSAAQFRLGARNTAAAEPLKCSCRAAAVYNTAPSTAELVALTSPQPNQPLVPPIYRWGGAGFPTAGSSAWLAIPYAVSGSSVLGVNGVSDGLTLYDDCYRFVASGGGTGHRALIHPINTFGITELPSSKSYRLSFDYYIPATNATAIALGLVLNGNLNAPQYALDVVGEWTHFEADVVWNYTSNTLYFILSDQASGANTSWDSDGDNFNIANMGIEQRGAIAAWSAEQDGRLGPQLRDRSPNRYDGLLAASGCTWTEPSGRDSIRARAVDASSSMYLLRAGEILPAACVVTALVVDGAPVALSGAQNPALRRIRLAPSGADLLVQRSDGTTHETLATVTPASLADVDLLINFQLD